MFSFEQYNDEQRQIIESLDRRDRWKFAFDTIAEFNLNQHQLNDLCLLLSKLGYRIDQLVGHEKEINNNRNDTGMSIKMPRHENLSTVSNTECKLNKQDDLSATQEII